MGGGKKKRPGRACQHCDINDFHIQYGIILLLLFNG